MKLLDTLAISASALSAERLRLELIAGNIANMNTTRTDEGGPYRRKEPIFAERLDEAIQSSGAKGSGVKVLGIAEDQSPPRLVYDPTHPDARSDGYVEMPNINIINEMVDMMTATRSYEASVAVVNATKSMATKAMEIGKG
ncbi:MAG: flagellar basal body rod protein FlgC [Bacillota bacterium]